MKSRTTLCLSSLVIVLQLQLLVLPSAAVGQEKQLTGKPWIDMNYGPNLTMSLSVAADNIAYKGIAVRLDEGAGGISSGSEFVVFDTDTFRYAAGWFGEDFINWRSVIFDGSHNSNPAIAGRILFANPVGPGWANPADGGFSDPRLRGNDKKPYGPLPRKWAQWKGHYLHGNRLVLAYRVGNVDVLESPSAEGGPNQRAISRTINLGPRSHELVLQVAHEQDAQAALRNIGGNRQAALFLASGKPGKPANADGFVFDGTTRLDVAKSGDIELAKSDYTITARIKTTKGGTILAYAPKQGRWAADGKTLFIRGGRLCFDIGWVGQMQSRKRVNDGKWHDIAMTFEHKTAQVRLFIDGKTAAQKILRPENRDRNFVLRLGFTSPNFPDPTAFIGTISTVRVYSRALTAAELKKPPKEKDEDLVADWDLKRVKDKQLEDLTGKGHVARLSGTGKQSAKPGVTVAALVDRPDGVEWLTTDDGELRLKIPAGDKPLKFKLLISQVEQADALGAFAEVVKASRTADDLSAMTKGGPRRWTETAVTQAAISQSTAPYVIDTLTVPMKNPYRSWMRLGGFDFFNDSRRAAVCTWMGDVWIVEGLGAKSEKLTWRRIASGMFQPLGVKVVNEQIYVCCRDQITRLHDLNGDGETDFYENFNNDHQVTEHFHEFAMDLQTDAEGNFYFAKSARHALDSLVPHHGTLIKVSKDGKSSEIVCNGFRAANGVGIGPRGELATSDQEGHWTPANRINLVRPGGFYGNMYSYHRGERPGGYDPPLCWLPKNVDRSPAEQLWVTSRKWGPLSGSLISTSYGTGQMFLVPYEYVDGQAQGGAVRFPLTFPTGIMRARFHPADGQLYVCGLFGWSSNKTLPGGFYRVRYTGQTVHMPVKFHAARNGIALTFSEALDRDAAENTANYNLRQWNYRWSANYGSPHFSVANPKERGEDLVEAASATLLADGKTVFLQIDDLKPVMQMRISYALKGANGKDFKQDLYSTLNRLGGKYAVPPSTRTRPPASLLTKNQRAKLKPGVLVRFESLISNERLVDVRPSRLVALHVPKGSSPTPFVRSQAFQTEFAGYIRVDLRGDYTFSLKGTGTAVLWINGLEVLRGQGDLSQAEPITVPLNGGYNRLKLVYDSLGNDDTTVRLYWSSDEIATEPIPPTALFHNGGDTGLQHGSELRLGRELFATRGCAKCHTLPRNLAINKASMPEMSAAAPALIDVGSRLQEDWLKRWILDPRSLRNNVTMPHLLNANDKTGVQDAADIAAYLADRVAGDGAASGAKPRNRRQPGLPSGPVPATRPKTDDMREGQILFEDLACISCHTFEKPDAPDEFGRTSLYYAGRKFQPGALRVFLRNPHQNYGWSRMPDLRLDEREAALLSAYVRSQSRAELPKTRGSLKANPDRGGQLFKQVGCGNCHAVKDGKPAGDLKLGNMLGTAGKRGCLADVGKPRGKAPGWKFDKQQRSALTAFLRTGGQSLQLSVPAEVSGRYVSALNCSACHVRDGARSHWPIILAEEGFRGKLPEIVPSLTWAGEKLKPAWTEQLIGGRLDYRPRSWLKARMPVFAVRAKHLAAGLSAEHGFGRTEASRPPSAPGMVEAGRKLFQQMGGFNCAQCHGVGDKRATAPFEARGVNFALISQRMRYDFYPRWMQDPGRFDPGTKMPKLTADGIRTGLTHVYGGDARKQFDALWLYIQSLDGSKVQGAQSKAGTGRTGGAR